MNRALSIAAVFSAFGLFAIACGGSANPDDQADDGVTGDDQEVIKSEGKLCGGFAGIACPAGSNCVMKAPFHPDQSGHCTKPKAGDVGAACGGTAGLTCKSGLKCKLLASSGTGMPPGAMGMPAPRKGTCQESDSAPKPGEEGGMCGGMVGFQCDPGLSCVMTGPLHPDQAGKCVKSSGPPPGAVGLPKPQG